MLEVGKEQNIVVDDNLLNMFKKSIGRLDKGTELDDYYKNLLQTIIDSLTVEDVSVSMLNSDFGKRTIIYGATRLMNDDDLATNPTYILMKNKLSALTKGERYSGNQTSNNS